MRLAALVTVAGCCALLALASDAHTATLEVAGQANIFGAGHATPPAPGGESPGILPPGHAFVASAGQVLTFASVSGTVSCCYSDLINYGTTGDGGLFATGDTDITSYGGISGIIHDSRTMFMVGVFLNDAEPVDPAPARMDFSPGATGDGFTAIAPGIGQTFYIGDGLTGHGSGLTQQFLVPATATRLYLGFADAPDFGAPSSGAGYYGDNVGQLYAIFDITKPVATPNRVSTWGRLKVIYH